MAKCYVVALDGSDAGWKALDIACDLAIGAKAALEIVHIIPYETMPTGLSHFAEIEGISKDEMEARFHISRTLADKITGEGRRRAEQHGVKEISETVREGSPASEIVSLAESKSADMIFIGSRGLSDVGGLLLGSVSHKVAHTAHCTCVIVR